MESSTVHSVQVKAFLVCRPENSTIGPCLEITASPARTTGNGYIVTKGKTNISCGLDDKGILSHSNATEKGTEFICDVDNCKRSFSSLSSLHIHQNSHTKRELVCTYPDCKRKFVWPHHLKYHLQTHKEDKPFKCDVGNCKKAFCSAQQREVHKRTHSGIKPFICDVCGKSFTTQQNRDSHHRTHTGSKPFKCDFAGCLKSFTESSSLRKHVLVHTGDKPHTCSYCKKRFTQISTLRVHERRYHIENAMPTRSIANIQAQQKAAAEAASKAAAAAAEEAAKRKDAPMSGELSAPSSLVYPDTSSPFITDPSIPYINEPLEVVETLICSNSLLPSQVKEVSNVLPPETLICSHSLIPVEVKEECNVLAPDPSYEQTYNSGGSHTDMVVYSDEQCGGEGERVKIEQNEGVPDGDYTMFHIFEETVVESEKTE